MRKILFRGKFGNEWKYGYLTIEPRGLAIKEPYVNAASNIWHIDTKTVGQYTGLNDKNGNKIFEGDIVDFLDRSDGDGYGVVRYDENETEFEFESDNICRSLGSYYPKNIEVIGNIYDNPEFLKEVQNYDKEINSRREDS